MSSAQLLLLIGQLYLGLGLLFALPFLLIGVQKLDGAADGAWAFRLLALPGCVALWPVLAVKLIRRRSAA